jgi:hypothetical protein
MRDAKDIDRDLVAMERQQATLSTRDAADLVGMAVVSVGAWCRSGDLKSVREEIGRGNDWKIGSMNRNRIGIRAADLRAYLESRGVLEKSEPEAPPKAKAPTPW